MVIAKAIFNQLIRKTTIIVSIYISISSSISKINTVIGIYINRALIDLNYADVTDLKFWQHHGEVNKYVLKDLAEIWHDHKPINRTFVEKVQQIFVNDGIKDYNIVEFVNYWFKIMKEDIEQFENNNN